MENIPLIETISTPKPNSRWFQLYLCNPKHFSHRIIVLFLTCFISFGSFFCYDNPAALQTMFLKDLNLSYEYYMSLYEWYSWPNVVMSLVGGFLIDNVLGIRLGTIMFGVLTVIGQILLAFGVYINKLWLMDLSRLIFGIGAESLAVAQNTYAAMWFKDKELNIVFGLQISISRLGSTINSNTMPPLYNYLSLSYDGKVALALSLVIASVTCIASLIFCFILGYLDLRAFKINNSDSLVTTDNKIQFKDILKFSYGLWALCIICILFYSSFLPFVSLAQSLFVRKYETSITQANFANGLIYIISAVASPLIGFGVDFLGRSMLWLSFGLLLLLLSHLLAAFTVNIQPYFITILMGLAYSAVASSLWGLVTYIVPRRKQGTAFGLMQALMNLGLGVVSKVSGIIVDNHGYFILEIFFIISTMGSLCALISLFIWNLKTRSVLNSSAEKRRRMIGLLIDD